MITGQEQAVSVHMADRDIQLMTLRNKRKSEVPCNAIGWIKDIDAAPTCSIYNHCFNQLYTQLNRFETFILPT